jgi:hypothetical protein
MLGVKYVKVKGPVPIKSPVEISIYSVGLCEKGEIILFASKQRNSIKGPNG